MTTSAFLSFQSLSTFRVFECLLNSLLVGLWAGLLCVILYLQPVHAQTASKHDIQYWLSGGFGLNFAEKGPHTKFGAGGSGRLGLHVQIDRISLDIPVTYNVGGKSRNGGKDRLNDAGILLGYAVRKDSKTLITASAGLARVSGRRSTNITRDGWFFGPYPETEPFKATFGIPIELGLYSLGENFVGSGLILHTNVNAESVFGGITFNLTFGDRD